MVKYAVSLTRQAVKDLEKLRRAGLAEKTRTLLEDMAENPYCTPPPYEKLIGDLQGAYSRRLNIQHRIVYTVSVAERRITVLRMWTHYE